MSINQIYVKIKSQFSQHKNTFYEMPDRKQAKVILSTMLIGISSGLIPYFFNRSVAAILATVVPISFAAFAYMTRPAHTPIKPVLPKPVPEGTPPSAAEIPLQEAIDLLITDMRSGKLSDSVALRSLKNVNDQTVVAFFDQYDKMTRSMLKGFIDFVLKEHKEWLYPLVLYAFKPIDDSTPQQKKQTILHAKQSLIQNLDQLPRKELESLCQDLQLLALCEHKEHKECWYNLIIWFSKNTFLYLFSNLTLEINELKKIHENFINRQFSTSKIDDIDPSNLEAIYSIIIKKLLPLCGEEGEFFYNTSKEAFRCQFLFNLSLFPSKWRALVQYIHHRYPEENERFSEIQRVLDYSRYSTQLTKYRFARLGLTFTDEKEVKAFSKWLVDKFNTNGGNSSEDIYRLRVDLCVLQTLRTLQNPAMEEKEKANRLAILLGRLSSETDQERLFYVQTLADLCKYSVRTDSETDSTIIKLAQQCHLSEQIPFLMKFFAIKAVDKNLGIEWMRAILVRGNRDQIKLSFQAFWKREKHFLNGLEALLDSLDTREKVQIALETLDENKPKNINHEELAKCQNRKKKKDNHVRKEERLTKEFQSFIENLKVWEKNNNLLLEHRQKIT